MAATPADAAQSLLIVGAVQIAQSLAALAGTLTALGVCALTRNSPLRLVRSVSWGLLPLVAGFALVGGGRRPRAVGSVTAFVLAALEIGGHAWEDAGAIWYAAVSGDAIRADCDFVTFANLTIAAAESAQVEDALLPMDLAP